jgi:hypothetical protein
LANSPKCVVTEARHAGQQTQPLRVGRRVAGDAHRGLTGDAGIVGDDEVEFVVERGEHLVELQAQQTGIDTEFDDHRLDLGRDLAHHHAALDHCRHIVHGDDVLDLECGERAGGVVEFVLVALERLQRLVGTVEQPADVLQLALHAAGVDVDDAHLFADADDRHAQRHGHSFGGAVPGAGLGGGRRGVGHEVHVRSGDAGRVVAEDDGAVHLRQFAEPLRRELGIEQKAARADGQHAGVVAHDDERTHLRSHDAVDAVAQRGARRHDAEGVVQHVVGSGLTVHDPQSTRWWPGGARASRRPPRRAATSRRPRGPR